MPRSVSNDRRAAPAFEPAGRSLGAWHGAWVVMVGLTALVMIPANGEVRLTAVALATAATPGALGLFIANRASVGLQFGLVGLWTICVATAAGLTGGLGGPLAVWMLTPLAYAALAGGLRRLAAAASMVTIGGAVIALGQAAGLTPPISPSSLGGVPLIVFAAAFVAAIVAAMRSFATQTARLQAANDEFAALLNTRGQLTLHLDHEGAILAAFGGATSLPPAESLPARFIELAEDPIGAAVALRDARSLGEAETSFASSWGGARTLNANFTCGAAGVVAVLRDSTEEDVQRVALVQAASEARAQNEGKSRFLANMSHELRTPLNAIVGFSDIMRSQMFGPLSAKYAEYAGLIHESGGHLLDLINDILDLSKVEAQRFELSRETFDAREAVAAALRLVRVQADGANVKLRGALPTIPVKIHADRRAIKQIVLNLLSNALKFTPSGGQVTVIMRAEEDELSLVVADNGVGISPADLERLGRPYEQAGDAQQRARGSGLGLSLVRAFAELHGGHMEMQSELGEGTVVSVRMPVVVLSDIAPTADATPVGGAASLGENVIRFTPDRRSER